MGAIESPIFKVKGMKATIELFNGQKVGLKTWQSLYNLPKGSSQIGRFFRIGERSFRDGLEIHEGVIRLLDVIRVLRGRSTRINSLDRGEADQERLKREGYKTAKYSPHVVKLAADIDAYSEDDVYDLLECIEDAEEILGYEVRKGWEQYLDAGQTFVHIDICPMLYGEGKSRYNIEHPWQWENRSEW